MSRASARKYVQGAFGAFVQVTPLGRVFWTHRWGLTWLQQPWPAASLAAKRLLLSSSVKAARVFTQPVQGVEAAGSPGRLGGKHEDSAHPAPGQCPLQAALLE